MPRPKPLSGFPEFLPDARIVEQHVLDQLRTTFELHGFASIETRAVEPIDRLSKGGQEIDKEVYVVRRLQADEQDADSVPTSVSRSRGDDLGMHFDLTVPFARYVLENAGHLQFPFRRYQIQKVWRGERPQEGRYREFTQADIDIVGNGRLADHHDVELPLVILEALEHLHVDLGLPPVLMHVNNRRLAQGFYAGLDITDVAGVLRIVDKYDKIGPEAVRELLTGELGLSPAQAKSCTALAEISSSDGSFADQVRGLGVDNELLETGLTQLTAVVEAAAEYVPGRMMADLKIARGLDYYTGTVYETELVGFSSLGTISAGGRYDALASDGKTTFPGVGLSFGVTRTLVPLLGKGYLKASRPVPTCVLVAVDSEETRGEAIAVATRLRRRGISAEVAPKADKFGKQIRYADRRSIPYVWFTAASLDGEGSSGEVKDIRSGEQLPADPGRWTPEDDADLRPQVIANWD